jgi:hypothetical protein
MPSLKTWKLIILSNIFFCFFSLFIYFVVWYSKGCLEGTLQFMKLVVHTKVLKICGMEKYDMEIIFHGVWLKKVINVNWRNVFKHLFCNGDDHCSSWLYVNTE